MSSPCLHQWVLRRRSTCRPSPILVGRSMGLAHLCLQICEPEPDVGGSEPKSGGQEHGLGRSGSPNFGRSELKFDPSPTQRRSIRAKLGWFRARPRFPSKSGLYESTSGQTLGGPPSDFFPDPPIPTPPKRFSAEARGRGERPRRTPGKGGNKPSAQSQTQPTDQVLKGIPQGAANAPCVSYGSVTDEIAPQSGADGSGVDDSIRGNCAWPGSESYMPSLLGQ